MMRKILRRVLRGGWRRAGLALDRAAVPGAVAAPAFDDG
jgi:hypothetical protein